MRSWLFQREAWSVIAFPLNEIITLIVLSLFSCQCFTILENRMDYTTAWKSANKWAFSDAQKTLHRQQSDKKRKEKKIYIDIISTTLGPCWHLNWPPGSCGGLGSGCACFCFSQRKRKYHSPGLYTCEAVVDAQSCNGLWTCLCCCRPFGRYGRLLENRPHRHETHLVLLQQH